MPAGVEIGAVRISASGRERSVIEGLKVGQSSTRAVVHSCKCILSSTGLHLRPFSLLAHVQFRPADLGMQDILDKAPPKVIMLELYPHSMPGGPAEATPLLRQLYNMGYTVMSHSG